MILAAIVVSWPVIDLRKSKYVCIQHQVCVSKQDLSLLSLEDKDNTKRSLSTSEAGQSLYNLYSVGAT